MISTTNRSRPFKRWVVAARRYRARPWPWPWPDNTVEFFWLRAWGRAVEKHGKEWK